MPLKPEIEGFSILHFIVPPNTLVTKEAFKTGVRGL